MKTCYQTPTSVVATALLCLILGIVDAQNGSGICIDDKVQDYNASAEKTIYGVYSNRTYSFSTAVKQISDYNTNQSIIQQNFWLESSPVIDTPWQELAFGGCLIVLKQQLNANLEPNNAITNPEGVTTCEQVLPAGCNAAWIRQLNNSIEGLPASQLNDTVSSCQAINITMPFECGNAFGNQTDLINAFGTPFVGVPSYDPNVSCPFEINIFNGSATQNAFARDNSMSYTMFNDSNHATAIGNNTVYDYFVKRTNAVDMVGWLRGSQAAVESAPVVNSVCLSPEEHILNNSRDPVNSLAPVANISSSKAIFTVLFVILYMSYL